jgi:integrase
LDSEVGHHLSKTNAQAETDRIRTEVRNGTFHMPPPPRPECSSPSLTVDGLVARYRDNYITYHLRPRTAQQAGYHLAAFVDAVVPGVHGGSVRLGEKPIAEVTRADIEALRKEHRTRGVVGTNRLMERIRHFFNWTIIEEYAERTPFKRADVALIKLEKGAEQPRHRRLAPREEEALLAHAGPHLYALIVAALETGCRLGELLRLQWCDVREVDNVLLLPAAKTKTATARDVPITARLGGILEMRRLNPAGEPLGPEAFVFGNELGQRIGSIKRAWQTCVLKAHGQTPRWRPRGWSELDAESKAHYRRIDLRFHDLRREFASRLREAPGISDHEVRDWLGHANITTTSRYLATTRTTLQRARKKFEQSRNLCHTVTHDAPLASPSNQTKSSVT